MAGFGGAGLAGDGGSEEIVLFRQTGRVTLPMTGVVSTSIGSLQREMIGSRMLAVVPAHEWESRWKQITDRAVTSFVAKNDVPAEIRHTVLHSTWMRNIVIIGEVAADVHEHPSRQVKHNCASDARLPSSIGLFHQRVPQQTSAGDALS